MLGRTPPPGRTGSNIQVSVERASRRYGPASLKIEKEEQCKLINCLFEIMSHRVGLRSAKMEIRELEGKGRTEGTPPSEIKEVKKGGMSFTFSN